MTISRRTPPFVLVTSLVVTALTFGCRERSPAGDAPRDTAAPATDQATQHGKVGAAPSLPDDPLWRELHREAQRVAPHLVPDGAPIRAQLQTGQRHSALAVLQDGRCYKVFGLGGSGVLDLDVTLVDGDDVQIQQSAGISRPVLGATESICPQAPGPHRIDLRMAKGAGDVVLQVYRTEP